MSKPNQPGNPGLTEEQLDAMFVEIPLPDVQEAPVTPVAPAEETFGEFPFPNPDEEAEEYVAAPQPEPRDADVSSYIEDATEKKKKAESFFSVDMSAEELAQRYIAAIDASDEPFTVMTVAGVEMEGVKEEYDNAEKKAARLDPNKFKDDIKDVNVYINGKQVKIEQLVAFIEDNKAEFVAACLHAFPDIDKKIEEKRIQEAAMAERKERRSIKDLFKKKPTVPANTERPVTRQPASPVPAAKATQQNDAKDEGECRANPVAASILIPANAEPKQEKPRTEQLPFDERVNRAMKLLSVDEMKAVKDFFDGPKKYVDTDFYLHNPETSAVEHVVKLKKTGGENRIYIDGKSALEGDLEKLIEKYPGQMHRQMEAQRSIASFDKAHGKGSQKPKSSGPAIE